MVHTFNGRNGLRHGAAIENVIDVPRDRVAVACGLVVAARGQTSLPINCEDCLLALGLPIPEPIEYKRDRDIYREWHNKSVSDIGEK